VAKHSGATGERKNFPEGRRAARQAARLKFGDGPLPINPATGKRWSGTGRSPRAGTNSPILPLDSEMPPVNFEGRWESKRTRAAKLRERMQCFPSIYNAAWMVRDSWHGSAHRRDECMRRLVAVFLSELKECRDVEALIFAVADAITASAHGVPWEG